MIGRCSVSLLAVLLLAFLPGAVSSQFPVDERERAVQIFEVLDSAGLRFGTIVVAGQTGRGFEANNEYWSISQTTLLEIADQERLEVAVLASGDWDDPWVVEALGWLPAGRAVGWNHPTEVEWTRHDELLPPVVPGGTYFGNATLGGLMIQYSQGGPSSLTWFKLTEGPFMQLAEGAVFEREHELPSDGSWWHGWIESWG